MVCEVSKPRIQDGASGAVVTHFHFHAKVVVYVQNRYPLNSACYANMLESSKKKLGLNTFLKLHLNHPGQRRVTQASIYLKV